MGTRVSRAGRKAQIFRVMKMRQKIGYPAKWTVGGIAKRLGMKSSTHLKNIMREMVEEYDEISIEKTERGDFFSFTPYQQANFLDRVVSINGRKELVASWIGGLLAAQS